MMTTTELAQVEYGPGWASPQPRHGRQPRYRDTRGRRLRATTDRGGCADSQHGPADPHTNRNHYARGPRWATADDPS